MVDGNNKLAVVHKKTDRPIPPINPGSPLLVPEPITIPGENSRERQQRPSVHFFGSLGEEGSPRPRTPSVAILAAVRDALERHPSFAGKLGLQLAKSPGPESPKAAPSDAARDKFWPPSRAFWRHTFYAAITVALLLVALQLVYLRRSDREQQVVVETALRTSISSELGPAVRGALTAQGALIAVNVFLAFRGVQIWALIQRVKVVPLLQRIGWIDRWRQARAVRILTAPIIAPIRTTFRGLMFPGKLAAERAAREAAAREAARRANRWLVMQMAEKAVKMPWRLAASWKTSIVN